MPCGYGRLTVIIAENRPTSQFNENKCSNDVQLASVRSNYLNSCSPNVVKLMDNESR
ncbi:unnamed protein product [Brugia timori]|uniref:Uncharacterized protein n=1 Tax=Brugia timori TaxID=42155 RepID=A0A0R3QUK5_9BILA|nr:unnamed protein product [Brugia timori]